MSVFKDYNGNTLKIDHIHKVADTQGTRSVPTSAGTAELLDKSAINLKYYSTVLTPTVTIETVGLVSVMNLSVDNSTNLNGNLVLKINTAAALSTSKEYVLVLEPLEDTVSKTNLIDMNFGTAAPYNYINATYISEDIANGSTIGYGSNAYLYKITPKQPINSIIVHLYTLMKSSGTAKKLLRISLRELIYTSKVTTAIATSTETGFMSAEDKIKLEKVGTSVKLIEDKIQTALFYTDDVLENLDTDSK